MTDIRILLAEDDKNLGTVLKAYLIAKGYNTVWAENGEVAIEAFRKNSFNFCIIDVMMPVKDGYELARDIRKENKHIPMLFLTARDAEEDKLLGFSVGADDYLTKPFSMEELLARMDAILRRTSILNMPEKNVQIYSIGHYKFDSNRQILTCDDEKIKLTSKETDLLKLLCEKENKVLEREEALRRVWGDDSYFNARSMDVYITKLRKYLKSDPSIELINVHGVGFKLIANSAEIA
ncbi:MAG: response regulator transcription factor [Bacteroidales bacterium]|jgi:DNA-binding response OmpR family regulator|nr:response regulator transcription factor [Bacteroidales bacterium]